MSEPGDVEVIAPISIKNSGAAPIARTNEILGSAKLVADITARDAIPSYNRQEGMLAYVIATDQFFQLKGGVLNANWVAALLGGGGTTVVEVVRTYTVGVAVRDLVYQKSDGTVGKVDISSVATAVPVVGFVSAIDSPSAGQCLVRSAGDLDGFTGLVPGKLYIASQALGGIIPDDDTLDPNYPGPVGSGHVVREVGSAVTSTTLFIGVIRDFDVL